MKKYKNVSPQHRGGSYKNSELYSYFGGEPLGQMHNALTDSKATLFIYQKGVNNNW
jgi:hypothetical protein